MIRVLIILLYGLFGPVPAAAAQNADLIIFNANVRTLAKPAKAEAIAIKGTRIIAVGSTRKIKKLADAKTEIIDAKGRLVIPGFNDSHVHFLPLGNTFSTINAREISFDEFLRKLKAYTAVLPKGRWILGSGLSGELTADQLSKIDKLTPTNPLLIYFDGGQQALVNSAAGKRPDIIDGKELEQARRLIPKNHMTNWLEVAETASNYASSFGITSIQEMSSDDRRDVYRQLEKAGRLKIRIYDCSALNSLDQRTGDLASDTEMVRGGCRKGFWEGEEERIPQLTSDIRKADKAGLQVTIHAIGGSANNVVLNAFADVVKTNGKRDRRFRIEHANGVSEADRERFRGIPVIASVQPHLFRSAAGEFVDLLNANVAIAFGSDAAMTDMNPLLAIDDAVNLSDGKLTVDQAVRAYTIGSAYAEFQENVKGTIEAGKYADLVMLSDDIFTIAPEKIRDTRVMMTITAGKVVYQAPMNSSL